MKEKSHSRCPPVFLFLWAAWVFAWCIAAIIIGEFHWGRRGPMIRPDTHPYRFWGFVSFGFAAGILAAWFGYKEFRNYLLMRKTEKRLEQERELQKSQLDASPRSGKSRRRQLRSLRKQSPPPAS